MSLLYLDMVFSETLRMYPPAEYLHRITSETYNVPNSNLVIEEGTPVFISVRGLHYEPKYFLDPDKFDPERFNEENKRDRPAYVYLPFGEGPRTCIGIRLGLLEMKLALVKISSKFEVSPCEKTLIPMKLDSRGHLTTPLGG
ncbi:cytochrome P450 6k1-like, partial [Formica exsecta]|uniref:cytochrome P450 6k1-like n=1 Tax=Formica exsecta TaxID=72781 RepID=UPI00114287BC